MLHELFCEKAHSIISPAHQMLRKLSRAISSVILVGVGIPTAGIGDAVLLPVIAGGGFGAGISGTFYAATCGQHCTTEGYISHTLSGGALGSLGGLAGPVAGASVEASLGPAFASGALGTTLTHIGVGLISALSTYSIDAQGGRTGRQMSEDIAISGFLGFAFDTTQPVDAGGFSPDAEAIASHYKAQDVLGDFVSDVAGGLVGLFG